MSLTPGDFCQDSCPGWLPPVPLDLVSPPGGLLSWSPYLYIYSATRKPWTLKIFQECYCVMTNHSKDQYTRTKPQNQKLISVLSFLKPDWLFPCNTIAFQKYFCCSRFSQLDCKRFPATRILHITFLCVFCSLSGVEPLYKTTADWKSLLI